MEKNCILCKICWATDRLYRDVYQVINVPNKYIKENRKNDVTLNDGGEEWFRILKKNKAIIGSGYNYRLEKIGEEEIRNILKMAELYSTDKEGVANTVEFEHVIF